MPDNKWRLLLTYVTEVEINRSQLASPWSKGQELACLEGDAFR